MGVPNIQKLLKATRLGEVNKESGVNSKKRFSVIWMSTLKWLASPCLAGKNMPPSERDVNLIKGRYRRRHFILPFAPPCLNITGGLGDRMGKGEEGRSQ